MRAQKTYRSRLLLVVAIPFLAILLSAGVVIGPYLNAKADCDQRIAKAGATVVSGMCAESALRLFSQHEAEELLKVKSWESKRIPLSESERERFELLHLYERLARVTIVSSSSRLFQPNFGATTQDEDIGSSPLLSYPEIRSQLLVRGAFENLVDFLSDLASCQRLILIDRTKMTSDVQGNLILQLGIRLPLQQIPIQSQQNQQHPVEAR